MDLLFHMDLTLLLHLLTIYYTHIKPVFLIPFYMKSDLFGIFHHILLLKVLKFFLF